MNWITRLFTEINELIAVMAAKLNKLNTDKENNANKQSTLSSTNAAHYPNVQAVKDGLDSAVQTAQTYTDLKVGQAAANYIPITQKGANNGVAELDGTGKVPSAQLPSYVDDVVDLVAFVTTNPTSGMVVGQKRYNTVTKQIYTSISATAGTVSTPEADKIYVRVDNNTTWRWSGSDLIQMNPGLTLGNTSATAYRGDHGLIAYTHANTSGNPHGTTIAQIPNLSQELADKSPVGHQHAMATSTVPGFVELGSDVVQNIAPNTPTSVVSRTYAVQLNAAGQMVVNVGWTDNNTTYTAGTLPTLNTGTSNTPELWSAKVLTDWGNGKYTKAADMGDPTVAIPDWSTALQNQTPGI